MMNPTHNTIPRRIHPHLTWLFRALLCITLTVRLLNGVSQDGTPKSQFHLDPYYFNPAAAGLNNDLQGTLNYRKQWVKMSGSPSTFSGLIHGSVYSFSPNGSMKYLKGKVQKSNQHLFTKKGKRYQYTYKHAVGGGFGVDKFGAFSQSKALLTYALHVPLQKELCMSFGLSGELRNSKLDPQQVVLLEQGDETYDAYLAQGGTENAVSLSPGVFMYSEIGYLGYGFHYALANSGRAENLKLQQADYHALQLGANQKINKEIELQEHLMIRKASGLPMEINLTGIGNYKEFQFGLGYQMLNAAYLILGYEYSGFLRVSYSFDFTTSDLRRYNSGSHEIGIRAILNQDFKRMFMR